MHPGDCQGAGFANGSGAARRLHFFVLLSGTVINAAIYV